MAKRRRKKLNPNRFQKVDDNKLFSFDPVRRDAFKWGTIAGGVGGFFMLWQDSIFWPIVGVSAIVFITNYHIGKASQRIPRWHATIIAFLGVIVAMFGVIIIGTIVLAFLQYEGGTNG